ncbi:MAG TPA: zf-HC2 domain-containing protein [Myxococcaceae bacterium]|nr:zf-HC2 domain-containing protein [Myxococcaceae bacterium]
MNQQGAHRYEDRLLEFAYGELPAAEARSIEAHVKGCSRCTGALREIEGVRLQMSQLAPEPAPDAGLDSLLAYAEQAARRAAAGPAPTRGWRRWMFGAVGAASLAAVLVVVGVVANHPETKPASPATIQMEEAKAKAQAQALDRAGESAPVATPAPAAAAPAVAASPQPLAEGQANEKNKDEAQEAKVGKAVGKKEYEVQRVDVSSDLKSQDKSDKSKADLDARDRESGKDRPDTMQNMVMGKGSRPAVPTTGTGGYAKKTAEAADGEMLLPPDTKAAKVGHAFAPAPAAAKPPSTSYRKMAPPPVPSKKKSAVAGSGGGLGQWGTGGLGSKSSDGPVGSTTKGKGGAKDDVEFDALFGRSKGGASTSGGTRGNGTARPSAPATTPPQAAPAPEPAARAQLEGEVQAKQRAAQAEATRRDEQKKLESAKVARMEEEQAAESLAKKSVATRERAPAEPKPAPVKAPVGGTPAPGGVGDGSYVQRSNAGAGMSSTSPAPSGGPAPTAQAPSRNRGAAQSVAMNDPPAPPPAAAPARQVTAPSDAEGGDEAPPQAQSATIPLSSAGPSSSRKSADAPAPSKVRTVNAQELFLAATRAKPGSAEEINGLIIAINAGLSGPSRVDALQRLCTRMEVSGDSRAYDYCSAWASADPGSAVAAKRARSADERWGPRAKAAKKAVDSAAEPAKAAPAAY